MINPTTAPAGPTNAIEAVTHPDPSAFYQGTAGRSPWYDASLAMWIVTTNSDIEAVLTNDAAKVRPPGEPCPRHLVGQPAGETFQRIARMNDGDAHRPIRSIIDSWFATLSPERVDEACVQAANDVCAHMNNDDAMYSWMFVFPSAVMVRLMGMDPAGTTTLVNAAKRLADAFGPGAGSETTEQANAAIAAISDALDPPRKAMANGAAGFLFQTYDATAALIGNTVAHLARTTPTGTGPTGPTGIAAAIDHVLARDPAIHNTRRFLDTELQIGGATIPAGATVLLVLAAATRDPAASDDNTIGFGAGPHRCPAVQLAPTIARHAVEAIVAAFGDNALPQPTGFASRQNARIPLFANTA